MRFKTDNNPKDNNHVSHDFSTRNTRQRRRAERFANEFRAVKEQHGFGQYSWAEGVTRKSARLIARNRCH